MNFLSNFDNLIVDISCLRYPFVSINLGTVTLTVNRSTGATLNLYELIHDETCIARFEAIDSSMNSNLVRIECPPGHPVTESRLSFDRDHHKFEVLLLGPEGHQTYIRQEVAARDSMRVVKNFSGQELGLIWGAVYCSAACSKQLHASIIDRLIMVDLVCRLAMNSCPSPKFTSVLIGGGVLFCVATITIIAVVIFLVIH